MAKHHGKKGAHPRASERREAAAEVQEQLAETAPPTETLAEREQRVMWAAYKAAQNS